MEISEQAAAILELRHRNESVAESKPSRQRSPSKREREARTLNVAIDAKETELAESSAKSPGRIERMDDEEFAAQMMNN